MKMDLQVIYLIYIHTYVVVYYRHIRFSYILFFVENFSEKQNSRILYKNDRTDETSKFRPYELKLI